MRGEVEEVAEDGQQRFPDDPGRAPPPLAPPHDPDAPPLGHGEQGWGMEGEEERK